MRRIWIAVAFVLFVVACQKGHPVSVKVDERMNAMDGDRPLIEKIAVLPFISSLNHADDPDGIAPATLEKFFLPALDERADYIFVSSHTVEFAIEREGWMKEYEQFLLDYPSHPDNPDMEFLGRLAEALRVEREVELHAALVSVAGQVQRRHAPENSAQCRTKPGTD